MTREEDTAFKAGMIGCVILAVVFLFGASCGVALHANWIQAVAEQAKPESK